MINFLFLVLNLAFAFINESQWIIGLNCFVAGVCFMALVDDWIR